MSGILSLDKAVLLLGLSGAALLAACSEDRDPTKLTNGEAAITGASEQHATRPAQPGATSQTLPTISAKEYFAKNVQPALAASCAACHTTGPGPAWIAPDSVDRSYELQFQRGYVTTTSSLVRKGPHTGGGIAMTNDQISIYSTWIALEMRERGDKAPPTVFEKLGDCLDAEKFKAIGFENLVTTARNADNNPQKETENAEECMGCNAAQCSTCHSADPGTGFIMAIGNDVFPDDHTFTETKSFSPPYLQKYFGVDTNGKPIASKAIKAKSEATVKTGKAYSHPMFVLAPEMEKAVDAFVDDAVKKYAAGVCGK